MGRQKMFIPDVINTLLMGLIFMVIVVTVVRPFVMHIVNGQMTTDDIQKEAIEAVQQEMMRSSMLAEAKRNDQIRFQQLLLEVPEKPKPKPVVEVDLEAEEAKAKGEKHIFALESDAGGFTPRAFGFTMSDEQFQKVSAWRSLIAPYGCSEFSMGGGGADIGPLNRTFKTPLAGLQPDSQRYFDYHHARNDTFEAVNKRELELGAVNMAALIWLVDRYGL